MIQSDLFLYQQNVHYCHNTMHRKELAIIQQLVKRINHVEKQYRIVVSRDNKNNGIPFERTIVIYPQKGRRVLGELNLRITPIQNRQAKEVCIDFEYLRTEKDGDQDVYQWSRSFKYQEHKDFEQTLNTCLEHLVAMCDYNQRLVDQYQNFLTSYKEIQKYIQPHLKALKALK